MTLRLFDTLRRRKVDFEPIDPTHVRFYACGPTVYNFLHVGNARPLVVFDIVYRHLRARFPKVTYVRNITDVDDKIIRRAAELGEEPATLTRRFIDEFHRDVATLCCLPPDVEPQVTDHLPEIVALVGKLVEREVAYVVDGDVYFDVRAFPPYGELSGQPLDQLESGARVEVDERKRSPADFAVWKSAKPNEPWWESPWGKGRPGWHIECSAMTVTHLGVTFDLHGGGKDLIFPHHENEIAQSQGADGEGTFARYWLHNGFLNFAGEKMSKSLGNVFNCDQIAEAVGGEALRFFCVSHHYRSPVDFEVETFCRVCKAISVASSKEESEAFIARHTRECGAGERTLAVRFHSLEGADRSLAKFYETLQRIDAFVAQGGDGGDGAVLPDADKLVPEARAALADDFNAPVTVASLHAAAQLANRLLDEGKGIDKAVRRRSLAKLGRELREVGKALGVFEQAPAAYLKERRDRLVLARSLDVAQIAAKIAERTAARAAKDYARGDVIRGELAAMGVALHDGQGGTDWSVQD
jgi:cysteinyl-tRNA synthetase